jgi:hypothetical protein
MSFGGGGGGDQVQKVEPWEGQKPFLEDVYGKAQDLYNNNPVIPWQGNTVAPVNDMQMGAIDMAYGNAQGLNQTAWGMLGSAGDITSWGMGKAAAGAGGPQDLSMALAPSAVGSGGGGGSYQKGSYTPSAFSSQVGNFTPTEYDGPTPGYTPTSYTAGEYTEKAATPFYLNPTENPSFMPGLEAALNPVYDKFLNEVFPAISSQAELQGAYGGSRQGVMTALSSQLLNREVSDATAKAVSDAYFKERALLAERENLEEQLNTQRYLGMEDLATRRYTTTEGLLQASDEAAASLASDRWKTAEGLASSRWQTDKTLENQRYLGLEELATSRFNTQESLSQRDAEALAQLEAQKWIAGLNANASIYQTNLTNQGAFERTLLGLVPDLGKLGMTGVQVAPSMAAAAGDTLRQYDQEFLDEAIKSYNADMMAPWTNLQNYANLVMGGNPGSTTTTSGGGQQFNPLQLLGPAAIIGSALISSREVKTWRGDAPEALPMLAQLPVEKWSYLGEQQVHVGPYAEDFRQATGLGDGRSIPVVDAFGLLLKAVQELSEKVAQLEAAQRKEG